MASSSSPNAQNHHLPKSKSETSSSREPDCSFTGDPYLCLFWLGACANCLKKAGERQLKVRLCIQELSSTLPSHLLISHKSLLLYDAELFLPFFLDVLDIGDNLMMNELQYDAPVLNLSLVVGEEVVPGEEAVSDLLSCFFEFVQFDSLAEYELADFTWEGEEACLGGIASTCACGDETKGVRFSVALELAVGNFPCDSCH